MPQPNYYRVLQVDPEAESEVIKAAYRALSRKYHPDGSHPSPDRMKQINDAYAVLSDPVTRARYSEEYLRWTSDPDRAAGGPTVSPPMRHRTHTTNPPSTRRKPFRRNRFSVVTQIGLMSVCLFLVVVTGLLVPRGMLDAGRSTATPTRAAFAMSADSLRAAFEEGGFAFDTEIDPAGETLWRGVDENQTTTVYIARTDTGVSFVSVVLSTSDRLSAQELAGQQQSIRRVLGVTLADAAAMNQIQQWITAQRQSEQPQRETAVGGWIIRSWDDAEHRLTGVLVTPAEP